VRIGTDVQPDVRDAIHRSSLVAAGLAAVLSPVPMADEVALLPVYGLMTRAIGRAHGLSPSAIPWRPVVRTVVSALVARAAMNLAVSLVPGVAAAANAASAVALTEWLGRYVDRACSEPASAVPVDLRAILDELRARAAA
jgi:uncharacterized protein (DUF697 family)